MRCTRNLFICLISFIISNQLFAKKLDSLFHRLASPKDKIDLCNTSNLISFEYLKTNPDSSFFFSNKALSIALKSKYAKGVTKSYFNIGYYYRKSQKFDSSIVFFNKSYNIYTTLNDTMERQKTLASLGNVYNDLDNYTQAKLIFEKAVAISKLLKEKYYAINLYNLANAYNRIGDTKKAMQSYSTAKDIFQQLGDDRGYAYCLNTIGILYEDWSNYNEALKNYLEALKISLKIQENTGIIDQNINIGNIYVKLKKVDKAEEAYHEAYNVSFKINDLNKQASALSHLGLVCNDEKKYEEANQYLSRSLELSIKNNFYDLEASIRQGIGYSQIFQKKYPEAIKQLLMSQSIADSLKISDVKSGNYLFLALAYSGISNSIKAFENYKLYVNIQDSTQNVSNELRVKYETEKQNKEILLLKQQSELDHAKILAKEAETARQRIFIFSIIGGLMLVLIFFVLIYKQYNLKKVANINLTKQKQIVENQKKEIEDSIIYAKRIQQAMLSMKDENSLDIVKHFLLFKPKSIVSGDFYWATRVNEWTIITVADCTGHGVPGAFMSMLGISFLTEIVRKKEIETAEEVLNSLRRYVIDALKQSGRINEQKDGMDISLVAINTKDLTMQYAGANNPLYLFKNNQGTISLTEIKPDKMPIAIYEKMKDFTNHSIQLEKGDKLCLFSDGFADQFGGPKGKKYNYARFKNLLTNTSHLSLSEQGKEIENELNNWISFPELSTNLPHEQTDDITLLIIEI